MFGMVNVWYGWGLLGTGLGELELGERFKLIDISIGYRGIAGGDCLLAGVDRTGCLLPVSHRLLAAAGRPLPQLRGFEFGFGDTDSVVLCLRCFHCYCFRFLFCCFVFVLFLRILIEKLAKLVVAMDFAARFAVLPGETQARLAPSRLRRGNRTGR